jgi:hypothetical protein
VDSRKTLLLAAFAAVFGLGVWLIVGHSDGDRTDPALQKAPGYVSQKIRSGTASVNGGRFPPPRQTSSGAAVHVDDSSISKDSAPDNPKEPVDPKTGEQNGVAGVRAKSSESEYSDSAAHAFSAEFLERLEKARKEREENQRFGELSDDLFQWRSWPTDGPVHGFLFRREDYVQLRGLTTMPVGDATEKADRTTFESLHWNVETQAYGATLQRSLTFHHPDGWQLQVKIVRAPSVRAANDNVLQYYRHHSRFTSNPSVVRNNAFGPEAGIQVGHASILRGVRSVEFMHTLQNIRSIVFVRHNIVVDLTRPGGKDFDVLGLAAAIDAEIQSQAWRKEPTFSARLSLSDSVVAFEKEPRGGYWTPARHEIAIERHLEGAREEETSSYTTVTMRHWQIVEEGGQPVPFWAWQKSSSWATWFEAPEPKALVIPNRYHEGHYEAVWIAWGPDLLPVITSAPFEVKRIR